MQAHALCYWDVALVGLRARGMCAADFLDVCFDCDSRGCKFEACRIAFNCIRAAGFSVDDIQQAQQEPRVAEIKDTATRFFETDFLQTDWSVRGAVQELQNDFRFLRPLLALVALGVCTAAELISRSFTLWINGEILNCSGFTEPPPRGATLDKILPKNAKPFWFLLIHAENWSQLGVILPDTLEVFEPVLKKGATQEEIQHYPPAVAALGFLYKAFGEEKIRTLRPDLAAMKLNPKFYETVYPQLRDQPMWSI